MRNCVTVIVFVLHVALCCCVTTSGVVAALQRYFYTECVFLLHAEDRSKYYPHYNRMWQKKSAVHIHYVRLYSKEICFATNSFYVTCCRIMNKCIMQMLLSTDHELIPARNANLVTMQGSTSGSNVRYYPTWKHSPLKERKEQGCYNVRCLQLRL
jgi:hypothetical protein